MGRAAGASAKQKEADAEKLQWANPDCGIYLPRTGFSKKQLECRGGQRFCPACTKGRAAMGRAGASSARITQSLSEETTLQCNVTFGCGLKLQDTDFAKTELLKKQNRLCKNCVSGKTVLPCGYCKASYPRVFYAMTQLRKGEARQCKDCKQCGKCQRYLPSIMYTECEQHTPSYMTVFRKRRCNHCLEEAVEKIRLQRKRDMKTCEFPVDSDAKRQA